ncbi:MAG: OmpH family outer membrane protein [Luteibaculaceae bacterium]
MKSNLALVISLLAFVTALIALFNNSGLKSMSEDSMVSISKGISFSDSSSNSTIFFVNLDSVSSRYLLVKSAQEELIAEQRKAEQRLQQKVESYRKRYEKVQEEQAYMTRAELEKVQFEFAQVEQEIQELQQVLSIQLAQKEDDLRVKYTRNIRRFVDSLSVSNNFKLVLGYNEDSNVLYADKTNDITTFVIDGLNDSYKKSKK